MGMYGTKNPAVKVTPVAAKELDLTGKTMTVVGGTSGVGRAVALFAAAKGAKVTVVGRSFKVRSKARVVNGTTVPSSSSLELTRPDARLLRQDAGVANVTFVQADFSSMAVANSVGSTLPPADVTVLSHGIIADKTRQVTAEGLEADMAISALSRLVLLRQLVPRLATGSRVFVWGMPGNGMKFKFDDLNAEKGYEGAFGFVHANTVGANEAIVLELAQREKASPRGVSFFGCNPGLIATGIRDVMHGGRSSMMGSCLEGMIGMFTPSVDTYASTMVPLLFAPGLEAHNGAMFGQDGKAILINPEFKAPTRVTEWYTALEALLKRTAGL